MQRVTVKNEWYGSYAEKINLSHFGLNLGQTAEDSDMFTNIWLSSIGLNIFFFIKLNSSHSCGASVELDRCRGNTLTVLRASERCRQEKRKTINGEDILFAMSTLGFDNYVEPLKVYLQKYREVGRKYSFGGSL